MSEGSVYDQIANWPWPNRRLDLNYSALSNEDLAALDKEAKAAGWFKTARLQKIPAMDIGFTEGFVARDVDDRLKKGMKACVSGWREALGNGDENSARLAAHSWHRHRERLNVWEPFGVPVLNWDQFKASDLDAAGLLLYTNFVSPFEMQRMVLNCLVRCWMWFEWQAEMLGGGMAVEGLSDPKHLTIALRAARGAVTEVWGTTREKDGWTIRGLDRASLRGGWNSTWIEGRLLYTAIPALDARLDQWSRVTPAGVERRTVNVLRNLCKVSVGQKLGGAQGAINSEIS